MRSFLGFVVRGRAQASVAATAATLLSILCGILFFRFPALIVLSVCFYFASAAIVTLTALRWGMVDAAVVMLGPAFLWAMPLLFASGAEIPTSLAAVPFLSAVLGVFVPVILLAAVLRATRSQALMLTSAGALVAASMLALDVAGVDPAAWMLEQLQSALEQMVPEGEPGPFGSGGSEAVSPSARALLQGIWAANVLLGLVLTVYLARWWHAAVDNPGGFGEEFRATRLDRRLGMVLVALIVVAQFAPDGALAGVAMKLLPILLVLYLIQGLAIAHALVRGRRGARAWLTALYLLLVYSMNVQNLPFIVIVAAGMLDAWIDFRRRWGPGT